MKCPECKEEVDLREMFCDCGAQLKKFQVYYVNLSERIGAAFIDLAIISIPATYFAVSAATTIQGTLGIFLFFHAAYTIGYTAIRGYTPGMAQKGIYVVTENFNRLGVGKTIARYFLSIPLILTLVAVVGAFDEYRQTLYDIATSAYVIKRGE